jgi:hypothetical protein
MMSESELTQSFQFITRVDPSAPLVAPGTLRSCIKRMGKMLKKMHPTTEKEIIDFQRIKIIREELRILKNQLH